MKDLQLLAKSIILLYKESVLKTKGFSSIDKITKILEDVSSRHSSDITSIHNVEKLVIDNLSSRIREMVDLGPEHDYIKEELLNDLEMDCYEDKLLFKVISDGISKEQSEEDMKRSVINLRRAIDAHYRESEIESILNKANYTFKFKRNTINNMSQFLGDVVSELERLDQANTGKDPSITSEVDLHDQEHITEIMNLAVDKNSDAGILKSGWQALNKAIQGGFKRGDFCMISSLAHKWKTGFSMSLFKQFALYNKPYMLDPKKKPLLMRVSTEDDIEANMQLLYQSLKYNETKEFVDIKKHDKKEMSAYIKDKMSENGYHIKMMRIDPTDWTYHKLLNKVVEYEAEGFEVHCCMVDYLSMIPTTGCLQLAGTGSDLRDMFRRVRNFMSNRKIAFITPMQLSSQASQLLRGAIGEEDFCRMIAGKGYYDSCQKLIQEVDMSIILHSFSKNDDRYINVVVEKHRTPIVIADSHKNFYLKFPSNGMPIPDDIDGEDSSIKMVKDGSNGRADDDLLKF